MLVAGGGDCIISPINRRAVGKKLVGGERTGAIIQGGQPRLDWVAQRAYQGTGIKSLSALVDANEVVTLIDKYAFDIGIGRSAVARHNSVD